MTTTETEWDEQEQGLALALAVYRATRCPKCGGDIDECGPASAGRWHVPPPRRCYRTDALLLAQGSRTKTSRPEALMFRVERR